MMRSTHKIAATVSVPAHVVSRCGREAAEQLALAVTVVEVEPAMALAAAWEIEPRVGSGVGPDGFLRVPLRAASITSS